MTIYLDYASATPVDPQVLESMMQYFTEKFGNPSSQHAKGVEAREAIQSAATTIKSALKWNGNIIFTSGGTESVSLALKGITLKEKSGHIITTKIEHKCILETCAWLETQGYTTTYLSVDSNGYVKPSDLEAAITPDTKLVSIGLINNETGVIQNIPKLTAITRERNIIFHTDASQLKTLPDLRGYGLDLVTLNSGKMYGPKGVGALLVKDGITLSSQTHGGKQQSGLRPGTENVPGIIGMSRAVELLDADHAAHIHSLKNLLESNLEKIPDITIHHSDHPWIIACAIKGIEAETLVKHASSQGVYISTGSACTSGDLKPSHVLSAMSVSATDALSSIRISTSHHTTSEDINNACKTIATIVSQLRTGSESNSVQFS